VGKLRVIFVVFVGERNDEIAIPRTPAFAQASQDPGFDPVYNLIAKRNIITGKVDIRLQAACLCNRSINKGAPPMF
jgi:hypothetical protein